MGIILTQSVVNCLENTFPEVPNFINSIKNVHIILKYIHDRKGVTKDIYYRKVVIPKYND